MHELGLVFVLLGAVVALTVALGAASWDLVFGAGLCLVAAGMALGVPTGFYYHVLLYRILGPRGALPRGWWLRPVSLHGALTPAELARIRPWFVLGAAGFVGAIAGCALVAVGVMRSR